MWLCKHFFEHFNLLVQFRCKINITYCSDSAGKEGCLAAFLIFVLAASLLMWSWVKLLPSPKRGDFCQELGETIAVFPLSH